MTASLNLNSSETVPGTPFTTFDAFAVPPTFPDPDSFNFSTSATIFDSQGNEHVQTLYFAKTANPNEWDIHSAIDGQSVTVAPSTVTFDSNGQVPAASLPLDVNIASWTPVDATGAANGAAVQPLTVNLSGITQFGADSSVSSLSQDGFTTGELRGVDVDETGVIFARFSNGQSQAIGQVALANFANPGGLQSLGNNVWGETFSSGQATTNAPGNGGTGVITSGGLEDSNVDITEQLVAMIVAQRNFQANAQVIETQNTVSQTIINI